MFNVPLKDGEEVDCRFSASQVFLEQKVLAARKFHVNTGYLCNTYTLNN